MDIPHHIIEKAARAEYFTDYPSRQWEAENAIVQHEYRRRVTAALEAVEEDMQRDEYHTMEELYEYRMLYNALAANAMPDLAVKSWRHSDGELCFGGGWFVVYLNLPSGQVSNHYKAEYWDYFKIPSVEAAPEYDGHTPAIAAERLREAVRRVN